MVDEGKAPGFKQQLALAGAPSGRLWVGWMQDGELKLRRSNRAASVFGATVTVAGPPEGGGAYQLRKVAAASLPASSEFPGCVHREILGGRCRRTTSS
jgi:hypothetical protein